MMDEKLREGDRVRLNERVGWVQPYKGWADRRREATVAAEWVPMGGKDQMVRVRFDRSRKGTGNEAFEARDLVLISRAGERA